MVKITLLEVHLDDADVDANATADAITALPLSNVTTSESSGQADADPSEPTSETGLDDTTIDEEPETTVSLAPLFVILGLVVVVVVLRRLLGGD